MTTHDIQSEAKQILVQLNDGSTWQAEYQGTELVLVKQLTDPMAPAPSAEGEEGTAPEPASEPEDGEPEAEPSAEPEPATADEEEAQGEPEGDPYEDIMDHKGYGATQMQDWLKDVKDVRGIPDHLKDKIKDPAFRAKLSSIMLDNKYDRRLRGRTRGKLDMGRLPKVPMMQRNVFTKKQSRKGKAYNVLLLVDESGSMGGSKAIAAAEATVFLLSQLDGLNINTAVIGFNGAVMIQKAWGVKPDYDLVYSAVEALGRINPWDGVADYGCNQDYDAMHFGYEYFNKAGDGENIMIMLSDGAPASDYDAPKVRDENGKKLKKPFKFHTHLSQGQRERREHLHHLVNSYKTIHSVGIGIKEGGWQIPEHFIIHDLDELKPALIKTLGNKIKRG